MLFDERNEMSRSSSPSVVLSAELPAPPVVTIISARQTSAPSPILDKSVELIFVSGDLRASLTRLSHFLQSPAAQDHLLSEGDFWLERRLLLDEFLLELKRDAAKCLSQKFVFDVWTVCFKAVYELYRSMGKSVLREDSKQEKGKIQRMTAVFLERSSTLLFEWLFELSDHWRKAEPELCNLVAPSRLTNFDPTNNADEKDKTAPERASIRLVFHEFLIAYGDILRYMRLYDQAGIRFREVKVAPQVGKAYNLLALVSIQTSDCKIWTRLVEAIYHYVRSECIAVPFPTTRFNLINFLAANMRIAPDSRDRWNKLRVWTALFIRVFNYFARSYLQANDELSGVTIREIRAAIDALIHGLDNMLRGGDELDKPTLLYIFALLIFLVTTCAEQPDKQLMFDFLVQATDICLESACEQAQKRTSFILKQTDLLPPIRIALLFIYQSLRTTTAATTDELIMPERDFWNKLAFLVNSSKISKEAVDKMNTCFAGFTAKEEETLAEFTPLKECLRPYTGNEKAPPKMSEHDHHAITKIRMINELRDFVRTSGLPVPIYFRIAVKKNKGRNSLHYLVAERTPLNC